MPKFHRNLMCRTYRQDPGVSIPVRQFCECAKVFRVEDAWFAGVGKRVPHGFKCVHFLSHGSVARTMARTLLLL